MNLPKPPATNEPALRTAALRSQQRLRTRRVRVEDLKLGTLTATIEHSSVQLVASVEDLSPYGAALVIEPSQVSGPLFLAGDRIARLVLSSARGLLYDGSAIVRRIASLDQHLVVGVEMSSQRLNLAEVYRHGTRHSFSERLAELERGLVPEEVSAEFKVWLVDLRGYLKAMKTFLTKEEDALRGEDLATRDDAIRQYVEEAAPHLVAHMNAFGEELNRLVAAFSDSQHVVHRRFAREHLLPLFLEAPFMRRAAEKPLGYAGDYEMMNMLYREHMEGGSLFGKVLNLYATQEGAARANINRIDYLGGQVRELVGTAQATRLRIASIGCGPAQEIRRLLEESPEIGPSLDVALIDQEERSIAYCERTLGPLALETGARIDFMRESVRRLLTTRQLSRALGTRDLIYSAGLFDYLNQAMFARLLSTLYEALVPGGVLLVGNVAVNNPSRWSMEYYVEWFLIHRSPEDLRAFGEALVPTPSSVEVESEPTGINLFLRVVK